MSWLNTSSITSLAISALKEAQKTIDKALDIQNEEVTTPTENGKYSGHTVLQPNRNFYIMWNGQRMGLRPLQMKIQKY